MSGSTPPEAHHLAGFPVIRLMARSWWIFVLRGAFSILFGILAFLAPGLGLVLILAFLAGWMIVDGVRRTVESVLADPTLWVLLSDEGPFSR